MVNNFPKYRSSNFTFDFFEKRSLNPLYQSILNNSTGNLVFNKDDQPWPSVGLFEIKLIPPYLHPNYNEITSSFKILKFFRTRGYIVNLEGFTNIDHYMTAKMKTKNRSKIRNRVRKLEKCFDIKYKFYFGKITRKEYDNIFERFEFLIKKRFAQRGQIHQRIKNWGFYKKTTLQFILEKKASLFVIFDRDKPIDICLNYHYENIVNHSIKTYDIDYAKFSLGNIDIYKQLDWCFENNFKIFDLMWGGLEYKERWCNEIHIYEHHLFYNKNYILYNTLAQLIIYLYKLKDFIKYKRVFSFLQQIKSYFEKRQKNEQDFTNYSVEKSDVPYSHETKILVKIDVNTEKYTFLREPLYNFQFVYGDSTKEVGVYKMANQTESYIIIGKKSSQKVILK